MTDDRKIADDEKKLEMANLQPPSFLHWGTFHDVNTGDSNILVDWNRISEMTIDVKTGKSIAKVYIDGESIQEIVMKERGVDTVPDPLFKDREQLKDFFASYLLKNVPSNQQAPALEFIMKSVHQGALLYPVSASAAMHLNAFSNNTLIPSTSKEYEERPDPKNPEKNIKIPGQTKVTSLITTPDGFIVNEKVTQNRLKHVGTDNPKLGDVVLPDKGQEYVYKAEASLKISFPLFTPKGKEFTPTISLEAHSVSYGNKEIGSQLDKRHWLQKIADFILKAISKPRNIVETSEEIEMQKVKKPKGP